MWRAAIGGCMPSARTACARDRVRLCPQTTVRFPPTWCKSGASSTSVPIRAGWCSSTPSQARYAQHGACPPKPSTASRLRLWDAPLLVRAGNRELQALHPAQMNTLWRRAFESDLVSPVVASAQSEVGAVVDRQGRLFAFHTRFGFNQPFYPQPIFGDQQLASASVAIVRRADRQASYVYVLGQLAREETNPQALFRIVTLENPLNRLEFGESTLHVGSRYHPTLLITGTQQNSYCLLTAFRAESNGGTVAGIRLR
jgi:hypothetical protein